MILSNHVIMLKECSIRPTEILQSKIEIYTNFVLTTTYKKQSDDFKAPRFLNALLFFLVLNYYKGFDVVFMI